MDAKRIWERGAFLDGHTQYILMLRPMRLKLGESSMRHTLPETCPLQIALRKSGLRDQSFPLFACCYPAITPRMVFQGMKCNFLLRQPEQGKTCSLTSKDLSKQILKIFKLVSMLFRSQEVTAANDQVWEVPGKPSFDEKYSVSGADDTHATPIQMFYNLQKAKANEH